MHKLVLVAAGLAMVLGTATVTLADDPVLTPVENPITVDIPSDHPDRTPTPQAQDNSCSDELGFLRMVRKQAVQAVMDEKVVIVPVCEGSSNVGSLFMDGNVGGLRKTIGLNETLMAGLAEEHFATKDVVGIRFGDDTVVLYVHKR